MIIAMALKTCTGRLPVASAQAPHAQMEPIATKLSDQRKSPPSRASMSFMTYSPSFPCFAAHQSGPPLSRSHAHTSSSAG